MLMKQPEVATRAGHGVRACARARVCSVEAGTCPACIGKHGVRTVLIINEHTPSPNTDRQTDRQACNVLSKTVCVFVRNAAAIMNIGQDMNCGLFDSMMKLECRTETQTKAGTCCMTFSYPQIQYCHPRHSENNERN